jgi:hypothetical protein
MRAYRELSDLTKQKISDGMKRHHANKTAAEQAKTRQNQSRKMKEYWAGIPSKKV